MKCPNCGASIKGDQKFCNKCGFDLSNIKVDETESSSKVENDQDIPVSETIAVETKPVHEYQTKSKSETSPILKFLNNNQSMIFIFVLASALIYCYNTDIGAIIFIIGILAILYLYSKNGKTNVETEFNKTLAGIVPLKNQSENKFWILETLAYGTNIIAIFKLPVIDLSDIFKMADSNIFTSGIVGQLNDIFNNGNISLFKLGTLTSKASSILAAYYKDDKNAEMTGVIKGLSELKWGIYIIVFCIILAIISRFIKNYEIPMQLVSGTVPAIIYLFIYFKIKNGDSDYAIIATFLGSGFYLGLAASIVLVLTSLLRLGKSQKRA
ncbi:zinc ribbon domain-containing protein [Companilactobacillus keshanensis]|uniref:Zinc-ribbon domain-containing protein n=1 Tax=Companilactobacillus keshanensis TaxID=2486003 RepID=A0ABW4BS11_9LACO|nr:zinc ribbon domain-containing protein [Companilactobacillus keshanensis]